MFYRRTVVLSLVLMVTVVFTSSASEKGSSKSNVGALEKKTADISKMKKKVATVAKKKNVDMEKLGESVQTWIRNKTRQTDTLNLKNPKTGKLYNLEYLELHTKTGVKRGVPFVCADFIDENSGQKIDVDFYFNATSEGVTIKDVKFHKEIEKK